jgi:membrane protein implicated in regulation of membrane protease activity
MYAGLTLIVAELVLGVSSGFDLLLIGLALISGGVVGQATSHWQWGIVATLTLLTLYISFGRRLLKNRLKTTSVTSNIDALIGQTATVVKPNQVQVDGEIWRAVSSSKLKVGDTVTILSVKGVTLKVLKST